MGLVEKMRVRNKNTRVGYVIEKIDELRAYLKGLDGRVKVVEAKSLANTEVWEIIR